MRNSLFKEQLTSNGIYSNNQVLSKFYYLLIFSPCLKLDVIVATVSCQLMGLFKSKESFMEKVDSENN